MTSSVDVRGSRKPRRARPAGRGSRVPESTAAATARFVLVQIAESAQEALGCFTGQSTVNVPFIPAAACPGTVHR